jgi:hypothetical protein
MQFNVSLEFRVLLSEPCEFTVDKIGISRDPHSRLSSVREDLNSYLRRATAGCALIEGHEIYSAKVYLAYEVESDSRLPIVLEARSHERWLHEQFEAYRAPFAREYFTDINGEEPTFAFAALASSNGMTPARMITRMGVGFLEKGGCRVGASGSLALGSGGGCEEPGSPDSDASEVDSDPAQAAAED